MAHTKKQKKKKTTKDFGFFKNNYGMSKKKSHKSDTAPKASKTKRGRQSAFDCNNHKKKLEKGETEVYQTTRKGVSKNKAKRVLKKNRQSNTTKNVQELDKKRNSKKNAKNRTSKAKSMHEYIMQEGIIEQGHDPKETVNFCLNGLNLSEQSAVAANNLRIGRDALDLISRNTGQTVSQTVFFISANNLSQIHQDTNKVSGANEIQSNVQGNPHISMPPLSLHARLQPMSCQHGEVTNTMSFDVPINAHSDPKQLRSSLFFSEVSADNKIDVTSCNENNDNTNTISPNKKRKISHNLYSLLHEDMHSQSSFAGLSNTNWHDNAISSEYNGVNSSHCSPFVNPRVSLGSIATESQERRISEMLPFPSKGKTQGISEEKWMGYSNPIVGSSMSTCTNSSTQTRQMCDSPKKDIKQKKDAYSTRESEISPMVGNSHETVNNERMGCYKTDVIWHDSSDCFQISENKWKDLFWKEFCDLEAKLHQNNNELIVLHSNSNSGQQFRRQNNRNEKKKKMDLKKQILTREKQKMKQAEEFFGKEYALKFQKNVSDVIITHDRATVKNMFQCKKHANVVLRLKLDAIKHQYTKKSMEIVSKTDESFDNEIKKNMQLEMLSKEMDMKLKKIAAQWGTTKEMHFYLLHLTHVGNTYGPIGQPTSFNPLQKRKLQTNAQHTNCDFNLDELLNAAGKEWNILEKEKQCNPNKSAGSEYNMDINEITTDIAQNIDLDCYQKQYWDNFYDIHPLKDNVLNNKVTAHQMDTLEWICSPRDVQTILEATLEKTFGSNKNIRILEIGCGLSALASNLVLHSEFTDITCIDFSSRALDMAKSLNDIRLGNAGKYPSLFFADTSSLTQCIKYHCANAKWLHFADNTFNQRKRRKITLFDPMITQNKQVVIEKGMLATTNSKHKNGKGSEKFPSCASSNTLQDVSQICKQVHRVLKPNGRKEADEKFDIELTSSSHMEKQARLLVVKSQKKT
ncbi:extracellular protein [Reticulomyxa filosa]|uniref:Extracellular protein n=1 Tax=Reticulomyxa filosa TaxID=46433 RepID=X6NCK1_RETFI|nr:extracellular protein [Reticulomyxa filosa]|eukprot:ETO23489.1 extracellular protein [Reticulomyxa filosa]